MSSEGDLGPVLLSIARSAIAEALGRTDSVFHVHAELARPAATFVTLRRGGKLRGCVGSVEPLRPLREDVRENAIAAAFRDPRFVPLVLAEFDDIALEVSLLSKSEPIIATDEDSIVACVRPGDGITIRYGERRATFLPQVWEGLSDPREFLGALKRKAGLAEDFWSPLMNVSRYRVTKWKEDEFDSTEVRPESGSCFART